MTTRKLYHREWRRKNRDRVNAERRERYKANRDRERAKNKEYRKKHRQRILERSYELRAQVKSELYALLGNKCVYCGFTDARALQVDHVKNNGNWRRRKNIGGFMYHQILSEVKSGSTDYQLLCANCNRIKESERRNNVVTS